MFTATNSYQSGSLKNHKFTIVQFWWSEVLNGSYWVKNQGVAAAVCFMKIEVESLFSCLFGLAEVVCSPQLLCSFFVQNQ
jgi:hypothetical protein